MSTLAFIVPGEPVAKARPRFSTRGGKPRTHTAPKTVAFEQLVAILCRVAAHRAGWTFKPTDRFEVILRVYRTWKDRGGDVDNYAKSTLDGCNGVAWHDDSHVRSLGVAVYQDAANPRVEVDIRKAERS